MTDDLRPFRERYSGPWTVELRGSDAYVVRAACGARLAWVYFRDLPREWRAGQFYALSRSEALAMASAIAALQGEETMTDRNLDGFSATLKDMIKRHEERLKVFQAGRLRSVDADGHDVTEAEIEELLKTIEDLSGTLQRHEERKARRRGDEPL